MKPKSFDKQTTAKLPRWDRDFGYINQYYGLKIKTNSRVVHSSGKMGQVSKADGNYIYIRWDGEPKESGPYHPTFELTHVLATGEK
jgi:hypothetical protein